jgi:ubiquinone/menaquinone biosynthesis C-methylase UbiE
MDETAEYYQLVHEAFRKLAPFYNLLILPASNLRERVASLIPLEKGARILDVATGTGAQAFAFARHGF